MEGRDALETADGRLEHDRGYLVRRTPDGKDWQFVEGITDAELDRFSAAAAQVVTADLKAAAAQGVDIVGIGEVTGIALGSSAHGAVPGFPGAKLIGETTAKPGESIEDVAQRLLDEASLPDHLNPSKNPYLPGSTAPAPSTRKPDEGDKSKYLRPETNPLIKI